jgi:hypothetical protein
MNNFSINMLWLSYFALWVGSVALMYDYKWDIKRIPLFLSIPLIGAGVLVSAILLFVDTRTMLLAFLSSVFTTVTLSVMISLNSNRY